MITIEKKCPKCSEKIAKTLSVPLSAYENWINGTLIQHAMPYLTTDEREWMITGYCEQCNNQIYGRNDNEI